LASGGVSKEAFCCFSLNLWEQAPEFSLGRNKYQDLIYNIDIVFLKNCVTLWQKPRRRVDSLKARQGPPKVEGGLEENNPERKMVFACFTLLLRFTIYK
jgi:hypothetical protein